MQWLYADKDEEAKAIKTNPAVAAHEAIMTNLHKTRWQHMLEKAPDELEDIEGDFSGPATSLFPVGKGDGGLVKGNDSGVGNRHAKDVRGQIFQ